MGRRALVDYNHHIRQQEGSGLSPTEYCNENGVSYDCFMKNRRKLGIGRGLGKPEGRFVGYVAKRNGFEPVETPQPGAEGRIEVTRGGYTISMPNTPEALRTLFAAMEAKDNE